MHTRRPKYRNNWILLLATTFLLISCLPLSGSGKLALPHQNGGSGAESNKNYIVITQQPTPTQSILSTTAPASVTPTALDPSVRTLPSAPAPLRFTLPSQDEAPISLWRPALYPNPWALGPYDHFFFARPIAADEVNWPLADYRYGGIFPGTTDVVHTGIDIDAPKYTPVLAAADGTVVWADYGLFSGAPNSDDPYGLAVAIRHEFGWNGQRLYTCYAHMDKILVKSGQEVKVGEQIGVVGETGRVTGPHLHFEVRIKNNAFFTTLNPELWLSPPVGWGVLVGRMENTNGSLLSTQDVTVRAKDSNRRWVVRTYGARVVNSDSYYRENLVLSDLPAGKYDVVIDYLDHRYTTDIEIRPGAVTYITFRGENSYGNTLPEPLAPEYWLKQTPIVP